MAVADTVRRYLEDREISPDVELHPHSGSSSETAELAQVSGHRIAKGIVLEADGDPVLVVIPASHHVAMARVRDARGELLTLAEEDDLARHFPDCEPGAVPAVGMAYDLPTLVDQRLFDEPEVYFEGGDHESLVRLDRKQFGILFEAATTGDFSTPPT